MPAILSACAKRSRDSLRSPSSPEAQPREKLLLTVPRFTPIMRMISRKKKGESNDPFSVLCRSSVGDLLCAS